MKSPQFNNFTHSTNIFKLYQFKATPIINLQLTSNSFLTLHLIKANFLTNSKLRLTTYNLKSGWASPIIKSYQSTSLIKLKLPPVFPRNFTTKFPTKLLSSKTVFNRRICNLACLRNQLSRCICNRACLRNRLKANLETFHKSWISTKCLITHWMESNSTFWQEPMIPEHNNFSTSLFNWLKKALFPASTFQE